jgi:hypothetical protein
MSTQYPGGFITKSPVAPTSTAASGIWTVDQALQYVKAGTWPSPPLFIEEMFSTYIYTGNSSTQTITNGLNLSGDGGLVWIKPRSGTYGVDNHILTDTVRGSNKNLYSNLTIAETTTTSRITAFNSNGFSLQSENGVNNSATNYVSWSFKEQSKFFDIVTYTGNGTTQTINHSLGSVPGFVIFKRTNLTGDWPTWHRGSNAQFLLGGINGLFLNTVDAAIATTAYGAASAIMNAAPTSTTLNLKIPDYDPSAVNASGQTYVAYLFAHDAGGFPASGAGSTNGISCGSFTTDGSGNATVTLGYEPQWLLLKRVNGTGNWLMYDNMRGMPVGTGAAQLLANTTQEDMSIGGSVSPTATGFSTTGQLSASSTYIYTAIRRGPMKTPTVGTSVFGISARTGTGANATVTGGQTDDVAVIKARSTGQAALWAARLTGIGYALSDATAAVANAGATILQANPWDVMDGIKVGTTSAITNASAATYINYLAKRAPGFMDVVCYEGIDPSIEHNLGVTPEMYIVKSRSATGATGGRWSVYHTGYATATNYIALNSTNGITAGTIWGSGPTASVIGATGNTPVNDTGQTYIAYLFATLAGISKVGSYTGTGALQTVNCGFTSGARFVLIKRTDTTGDWYTYDSARGLSSSTDPYFLMNSSAAETTGTNYVDTDTTGFKVTAAAPADLNAVGGNYIFLAIA